MTAATTTAASAAVPLRRDLGPLVPAPVLARLLAPVVEREGGPGPLARRAGVPTRRVWAILAGRQRWVSLDVADRLITRGLADPGLWQSVPELASVYSAAPSLEATA